jgi:hypothetical protein
MLIDNLDAFSNSTAARLEPDRAARWLTYWDTYSSTVPDSITDLEYSNLTLGAWHDFRELDEGEQIAAISRAWNIRHPRSAKVIRKVKPSATVAITPEVKPWEPCVRWGGTRTDCAGCRKHEHGVPDTAMRKAQSLFELHSQFVRRHIFVEFLPSGQRYDATEVEGQVWFAVAKRMPEYLPLMATFHDSNPDNVEHHFTDASENDRARVQQWLRAVVHTVVIDVVRGTHAEKRDIDNEVPMPDYVNDRGIPNPADSSLPARPTPTAGMRNFGGEKAAEQWDAAQAG